MADRRRPAGADYVAMTRLTDKDGAVLAVAGETCESVPENSLAWLANGGHIRLAAEAVPEKKGGKR